jgi:hypothetical protein
MRLHFVPWTLAAALLASWSMGIAQPSEKGVGRDGGRPADGAIKGGSILPGETAGLPKPEANSRCADLTGTLKEQCLAQEQGSTAGGTVRLPDAEIAKPPPTREAPPPQNPR